MKRREFVKISGAGSASLAAVPVVTMSLVQDRINTLKINPEPKFDLSPWLYMQFMEPLGVTDSSVEAAWDHGLNRWRDDLIEVTKELAPGMVRWGGCFSSYYKWKEGIGPREKRKPIYNVLWGGMESNQVGTSEFVDFCRQVGADPLMAVNFESDGQANWAVNSRGENRKGDAAEASEWVDYCNNPSNKLRIKHGHPDPLTIKVWQLGNETSYSKNRFNLVTAAQKTVEFAKAMRKVDPTIQLIGWGDSGWAPKMIELAGEHLHYIAFHHMFNPARDLKNSPLRDNEYRKEPVATWEILMNGYKPHEEKINGLRTEVGSSKMPLAMTECHYTFPGRNRCEILSSWAAGVSYARFMNVHERNGDILKIATAADFCGTRWQVNAIMIPVPTGKPFMMPVAKIMWLYKKHSGNKFLEISNVPDGLDITASRTENKIFLHVINVNRAFPLKLKLEIINVTIKSGRAFELSTDPEFEILSAENDPLLPKERNLPVNEPIVFPSASVTAIELIVA